MKKHLKLALATLSAVGLLSIGLPNAEAADGTWIGVTGTSTSWGTGANWSGGSFPNAVGAVATFDSAVGMLSTGTNLSVSTGASNKTVGTLNVVNNSSNSLTLNASTAGIIVFDATSGNASLSVSGSSTQITTFSATMRLDDTLAINVSNTAANVNSSGALLLSSAAITGTGGIIKTGDGTMNISGTQAFTGGVVLQQGALVTNLGGTIISGTTITGPFGTGVLTLQSGTLRSFSSSNRTYYNAVNLAGNVSLGGLASGVQSGTQTFSASAGYATTLTASSTLNTLSDVVISQNITGTNSAALGKSGTANLTLSGTLSNINGISVSGGTLNLSGLASNITGGLSVSSGLMSVSGTVASASGISVSSGTMAVTGTMGTVGSFSVTGGGVLSLGGVSTMGALGTTFTMDNGTIRFGTTITTTPLSSTRSFTLGAGGGTLEVNTGTVIANGRFTESALGATLTKTGTGTWIMNGGTSTYTGATTVSQGTLLISSGVKIATSNVTVNSGATLGGFGELGGSVTVSGTLAPGISGTAGTLTVSNALSLNSSAAVTMKLGGNTLGTYDQVTGITNLTLDGTITVSLLGAYDPTVGSSFQLLSWSGVLDATNFDILTDLILPSLDPGMSWDTSTFLTDGTITAVPEPATNALLVCSVGLVAGARRFFGKRNRS